MNIRELDIPRRVASVLEGHGFSTVEEVLLKNARELLACQGFGSKALSLLETSLVELGLELPADPYGAYECAREGLPRRDAGISDFFLCESCATIWTADPFGGTEPSYMGEAVHGFCLNCNQERSDIHLYQWFLCGNCERVARSIGKSVVSASSVVDAWNEEVRTVLPHLKLHDIDTPKLNRRDPATIAQKMPSIDFVAIDNRTDQPVLGLELKTGRNYIGRNGIGSPIAEFQLDTSDCDDILSVLWDRQFPIYLIHAQVIDRAFPPTVRHKPLGRWWTDLFSMNESFDRVQRRPRETRQAAYYKTDMFRPFEDFPRHLASQEFIDLRDRFVKSNWRVDLY